MLVAGVDVGAATAKAVILSDGKIFSSSIIPTGHSVLEAAERVIQEALDRAGVSKQDLDFVISTGWGRSSVPLADKASSEIICHAKGVAYLIPNVRTIIDIGGQDSKVIVTDDTGNVIDFAMNDKCAAGTGRFLEVMANALDLKLEQMGAISLNSTAPCPISSTCTVFAETEMIALRAQGKRREDLVAGIHKAIARRIAIMASRFRFETETVLTGGVALNIGVKKALEEEIGMRIISPNEPQITGALGAALLAVVEAKLRFVGGAGQPKEKSSNVYGSTFRGG